MKKNIHNETKASYRVALNYPDVAKNLLLQFASLNTKCIRVMIKEYDITKIIFHIGASNPNIGKLQNTKRKSIRIDKVTQNIIIEKISCLPPYTKFSFSEATLYALDFMYFFYEKLKEQPSLVSSVLPVHGSKKGLAKYGIETYTKVPIPSNIDTFIEPFGGSGVMLMNATQDIRFKNCIYNDLSVEKANFFCMLKYYPDELIKELEYYADKHNISTCSKNIENAVRFFVKENKEKLPKNLSHKLRENSYYLQRIDIKQKSAYDIISTYQDKENALIFIDEPYRNTSGYEVNLPDKDRQKIAKKLTNINGIFLYCCRITAPRNNIQKENIKERYTLQDAILKKEIDYTYGYKNFYYKDYKYLSHKWTVLSDEENWDGTIERIISNYPFPGFKKYVV